MANAFEPQSQVPQPSSSGSGKGCLIGCLIAAGLFVASVLCVGIGGYWFLNKQIEAYTSTTPADLPTVDYSEEELAALQDRVKAFREQLDAGEIPEEDLILTADDVNALISSNEDFKGKVFVKIENDQVKGDVSFPLDKLPMGKGRYFNGSATFDVSMDNGVLIVTAEQAEVNGQAVPEDIMVEMRKENLAQEFYKDSKNAKFMRQFEDIRVEDNKIILRVKRDAETEGETTAEADESSETVESVESTEPEETEETTETEDPAETIN